MWLDANLVSLVLYSRFVMCSMAGHTPIELKFEDISLEWYSSRIVQIIFTRPYDRDLPIDLGKWFSRVHRRQSSNPTLRCWFEKSLNQWRDNRWKHFKLNGPRAHFCKTNWFKITHFFFTVEGKEFYSNLKSLTKKGFNKYLVTD